MVGPDFSLELCNIYHSGQVEPASCFQTLFGTIQTGIILKDVSLEVKAGEVLAILGSKGSGKRVLLEVISRRTHEPTKGQVLLDGAPMTVNLFQRTCGYVNHHTELIPTISVEQTIHYYASLSVGSQMSSYLKKSRVKQVMADLALSQVARWNISKLNTSEYRRVVIGTQLIKDPMLLLLDEPTVDLDPLTTYLIVSMLSNHAKRRGRIIVLTMEKPRSDVFPFLDRVTYLCLGDVVYSGPTRLMLEYFNAIGFPCPQLENPLMYYLCLSTVDRRSRERFIESNTQIVALVDKFKMEGGPYRKPSASAASHLLLGSPEHNSTISHKLPYSSFSKPGSFKVGFSLYLGSVGNYYCGINSPTASLQSKNQANERLFSSTFCLNYRALCHLFMRIMTLPLFFLAIWFFFRNMQPLQRTFMSRNGLLFVCILGTYVVSIVNTAYTFAIYRNSYYDESRQGLYSGPLFLFTYWLFSLPFSFFSTIVAAFIVFQVTSLRTLFDLYTFAAVLWGCYLLAEQQAISLMMVIKSSFMTIITNLYISIMILVLGTGSLRSFSSMSDWLVYFSYICQTRYAAAFLNRLMFGEGRLHNLPIEQGVSCSLSGYSSESFSCRYADGGAYLAERYTQRSNDYSISEILDANFNLIVTFVFPVFAVVFNCLLYLVPLPGFIKAKFRE